MILFGHPTGNPNSHNAALAHLEAGRLDAFAVSWFPSQAALSFLHLLPLAKRLVGRLERRRFEPLAKAPKIQGRFGEFRRLAVRALGRGDEGLSYKANDWLMRTMARESHSHSVTAVHSYEDASLWSFEEAKRQGKACLYDMPAAYFPSVQKRLATLAHDYGEWLPTGGLGSNRYLRPEQKKLEMELADLVLAPSSFVETTIREYYPNKTIARAAYGVDLLYWQPATSKPAANTLRFICAGQISLSKGIPLLLEAWRRANLKDARLDLVGLWRLADSKRIEIPDNVRIWPPCSRFELRERFQDADVLVFPSFFDGFGLVLLEAMACGLPAIASDATAAKDVLDVTCGQVIPVGDTDALVESLRWFENNRSCLLDLGRGARAKAAQFTWESYRRSVSDAVTPFV